MALRVPGDFQNAGPFSARDNDIAFGKKARLPWDAAAIPRSAIDRDAGVGSQQIPDSSRVISMVVCNQDCREPTPGLP